MELLSELTREMIAIEDLYLNPNNPRLMEKKRTTEVPDERVVEQAIQDSLIKEIMKEGVLDIIEKVKRLGFLTIDRIVVRKLAGYDNKYVVLEGNRRVASAKIIGEEHTHGYLTLTKAVLDSLTFLEVLVYTGSDDNIIWLLQGMRHINGIKEWGPLQQSRFLFEMQSSQSLKATELDKMTGLGRNSIANKIRSFKAYQYCREIYHGDIEENNFSLFQEVIFARPLIKNWLGWDDAAAKFNNEENIELLLNWYLGDEMGETRISRAIELRDFLNQILLPENKQFLSKFINNYDYSAKEALQDISNKDAKKNAQRDQLNLEERLNELDEVLTSLNTLPVMKIVGDPDLSQKYISRLEDIGKISKFQLDVLQQFKNQE